MKKLFVITLICILVLTGCGTETGNGDAVRGGDTSLATKVEVDWTQTESTQPAQTEEDYETSGSVADYKAAIMVDGEIYYLSSKSFTEEFELAANAIGYTSSYTDGFPQKDGETNFNRELEMPYAKVSEGIAVFYENEWHLCTPDE